MKQVLIVTGILIVVGITTLYIAFHPFYAGVMEDARYNLELSKGLMIESSFVSIIHKKEYPGIADKDCRLILVGRFNVGNALFIADQDWAARDRSPYFRRLGQDTLSILVPFAICDDVKAGDSLLKKLNSSSLIIKRNSSIREFAWLSAW